MKFLSLLCSFLLVLALSSTAYAEENTQAPSTQSITAPPQEKGTKKSDMSDIPDDYIIEASKFGEECRNEPDLHLYFNCQCLAVKFLDYRKKLGPGVDKSSVRNSLGKECKDGTGIAGQIYEQCLKDFAIAPKHLDPEQYCTCYGNTFAKLYEDLPGRMTLRNKISLQSRAQVMCKDPEAARRLYGTR